MTKQILRFIDHFSFFSFSLFLPLVLISSKLCLLIRILLYLQVYNRIIIINLTSYSPFLLHFSLLSLSISPSLLFSIYTECPSNSIIVNIPTTEAHSALSSSLLHHHLRTGNDKIIIRERKSRPHENSSSFSSVSGIKQGPESTHPPMIRTLVKIKRIT